MPSTSTLQTNRFSKNTLVGYCEVDLFEMLTKVTLLFISSLNRICLHVWAISYFLFKRLMSSSFSLVGCIPFS